MMTGTCPIKDRKAQYLMMENDPDIKYSCATADTKNTPSFETDLGSPRLTRGV
jgi:hypothetical protein